MLINGESVKSVSDLTTEKYPLKYHQIKLK